MNPTAQDTFAAYRAYVTAHGKLPRTFEDIAKTSNISVVTLREMFSSLHEVTQQLWEELTFAAAESIQSSAEVVNCNRTEHIILLFMAILDAYEGEHELALLTLRPNLARPVTCGIPLLDSSLGIRRALHRVLPSIIAHPKDPQSPMDHLIDDRILAEGIIAAFLSTLAFWVTDRSAGRAHTEAYVDHVATIIGSALESSVGTAVVELAKFVGRTRGIPLITAMMTSPFGSQKNSTQ